MLEGLVAELVAEIGLDEPLRVVDPSDPRSVDQADATSEVLVVDLGMEATLLEASPVDQISEFAPRVERVLVALDRLIALERRRIRSGEHPRRIVLVNSGAVYWDAYVLAHLDCSYTTFYSRVRRATVKPIADESYGHDAAHNFARRLIGWSARSSAADRRLQLRVGAPVTIARLDNFAGFGTGWAFPDGQGIWTQGRRSELALRLERSEGRGGVLALGIGGVCIGTEELLKVVVHLDGEIIETRDFGANEGQILMPSLRRPLPEGVVDRLKRVMPYAIVDRLGPLYARATSNPAAQGAARFKAIVWRIKLPPVELAQRDAQLVLVIEDPRSPLEVGWSLDERPLGLHLRSLMLE
jgi:hypothetical protein